MDLPPLTGGGEESGAPFEWSDLFDFTIDDQLLLNLDVSDHPKEQPPVLLPPVTNAEDNGKTVAVNGGESGSSDRVRKRDPRMICKNFLAGRVPCACPELDALMAEEEEEEAGPGKKRPRMGRTPGVAKCQVPGCEVDIRELKGYHRRHRVCLVCANATSVVIEGETKRYCQQCGKFHLLSDFDEGKRSCRRKLERHNNRRRRKSADYRGTVEKEPQGDVQTEDVFSDGEAGKENAWSGGQIEKEDSKDKTLSNLCSALESQNIESDSNLTFTPVDKVVDNLEREYSPPSDTKSAYTSACPTGRISFKLYDWNPAEFPRRLRHQIFQWLASMPVELEGYIRPGCTILTVFVSMPQYMWVKLFEDPVSYVQNSVGHGGILSGRGAALVYLNDLRFRVMREGASVMKVKVAVRAPRLHYIYPPCFEAGKPMDFVACGSNLLQPKFRSLVSFAGKYLAHDYYVAFPRGKEDKPAIDYDYQLCRIYVPHTEPSYFGPAFVEVENECGLSNFIPILIGDAHVCSEIKLIHQKYDCSNCRKKSQCMPSGSSYGTCEVSCSRQAALSEFMLDVAWLLKQPCSEKLHCILTSSQIQRYNCLIKFLISNKSTSILEKILQSLQIVFDGMNSCDVINNDTDRDRRLLKEYIAQANDFLRQSAHNKELILKQGGECVSNVYTCLGSFSRDDMLSVDHTACQVTKLRAEMNCTFLEHSDSQGEGESISLINREVAMNVNDSRDWPKNSCHSVISKKFTSTRPFIYAIAVVAVCFGVCAVVLHPYKVTKFAVTIRRCVFDNSS
ncbi:squamosa promoter-binding-like protein 7 [Chenopodium quinoa]|uniref:squamosa promoter-binding-like protein 7 n=1 Tax=Chenopodium quinoa TaxID=63459 RepID=UPI000B79630C|nr:squamosa promoter-binding-like protein 7 [Chenopodium quinoa]